MNRLGELLGSVTRGNIIEALTLSDRPLTAYRVARRYNMNVAKVYVEMKKLNNLGLVKPAERGERGREYELVDDDLRNLALKLSTRVQTLGSWKSGESKRARFRMGLVSVPSISLERPQKAGDPIQRRMPGELENLAVLGRKKFDSKYRKSNGRDFERI
ncbi:MAG: helix-turn-helix domain-containing protein [Thaumarchaeota archaeon]|nr:helix-turn-helix domain-containing protein [Nitrososphaerota archaeon]